MKQLETYSWRPLLLRGILAILLGLAAILWPAATASLVVLWIGAYFLVDGIFVAVLAIRSASHGRPRWFFVIRALIGILAGIAVFLRPENAAVVLVVLLGIWAILTGIIELGAAFVLTWPALGRWLIGIGGVLSIVFGTLLFRYPIDGILVILWLLGVYAISFGILMIVSSIGLKNAK